MVLMTALVLALHVDCAMSTSSDSSLNAHPCPTSGDPERYITPILYREPRPSCTFPIPQNHKRAIGNDH